MTLAIPYTLDPKNSLDPLRVEFVARFVEATPHVQNNLEVNSCLEKYIVIIEYK